MGYNSRPGASQYNQKPGTAVSRPASTIYADHPNGGYEPRPGDAGVAALGDGWATAPVALFFLNERLLSTYAGSLFRVRRADNNAEADIGFDPATNLYDAAALAAHCTSPATNGLIAKVYDQSGNGYDCTVSDTTKQPKVYDSATGPVLNNSTLCCRLDNVNDAFNWSGAFGMSGSPAISTWDVWSTTKTVDVFAGVGNPSATTRELRYTIVSDTTMRLAFHGTGTGNRSFTASSITTGMQSFVCRVGAGAQIGTIKCRQNGADLVELSSTNPTTVFNPSIDPTASVFGTHTSGPMDGLFAGRTIWNADIADADADICDDIASVRFGL